MTGIDGAPFVPRGNKAQHCRQRLAPLLLRVLAVQVGVAAGLLLLTDRYFPLRCVFFANELSLMPQPAEPQQPDLSGEASMRLIFLCVAAPRDVGRAARRGEAAPRAVDPG